MKVHMVRCETRLVGRKESKTLHNLTRRSPEGNILESPYDVEEVNEEQMPEGGKGTNKRSEVEGKL